MVTHSDLADGLTYSFDHSGALMAKHHRSRIGDGPVEHRHVAVTKSSVMDPHKDLSGPWSPNLNVVTYFEFACPDRCSHLSSSVFSCVTVAAYHRTD